MASIDPIPLAMDGDARADYPAKPVCSAWGHGLVVDLAALG